MTLVYGGGSVGLMGKIANTVLQQGGEVIGVIPETLFKKEVALLTVSDLKIVHSMHERKALIEQLSDGFIAMPGGLGTIEEIFEMLTWGQLGLHNKPAGFLNTRGYFNSLFAFLDSMQKNQFIHTQHYQMIINEDKPDRLLDRFESYLPPATDKSQWAKDFHKTR